MEKTLLIVTTSRKAFAPQRIFQEATKLNLNPILITYRSLFFDISSSSTSCQVKGKELPNADYVILREPGYNGAFTPQRNYLLHYYNQKGVRILNKETFLRWSNLDKLTQSIELQKNNVPFVESKNYGSKKQIIESVCEFPVIAKSHSGSHGDNVYKIDSRYQLLSLLEQRNIRPSTLLFQPFLIGGEDLRVIVIGRQAIGAMKRIARSGEYLTNYSVGGAVENYNLDMDSEAKNLAEKTATLFECEYAGVDLMKDNEGNWRVLEINRSCQFEGFEQATGIVVAKHILSQLQLR